MGKQNNTVKIAVPGFFGCSGVPLFRGVQVFWGVPGCSGVPVFRCSGMFRGVQVFRGVPGCSGVPVFLVLVHADYFSFSPQRACNGKTIGSHLNWNFQRGWGVFDKIPSVGGGTCMDIFWNYTIKVKLTSISQTELTCTLNCSLTKTVHV